MDRNWRSKTGIEPKDIAARLKALYSSNRGSGTKPPKGNQPPRHRLLTIEAQEEDENNNSTIVPCICDRASKVYECGICHQYFRGRLTEKCVKHPFEVYLMDFRECPYCQASIVAIKESDLTWEQIRKIEDATLPGGNDDL
ncbi:uncharacterized protein CG13380-like [Scaptodrosophila lebanonensis]|uniref:Uncharacterized protein CG13380-like n=1 Tax=Drosophila lebanonensis TaxID=7225 RepID=A0A6J2TD90_DROLE|nr:uncharacterized protein CG13380-like [Scaptodrosophila lebanonensis]